MVFSGNTRRRWRQRVCYIFSLFLISILLKVLLKQFIATDLSKLLERHKCPACYGRELCSDFDSHLIDIKGDDLSTIFSNTFNAKNVYRSYSPKYGPVVVKKLAHDWELDNYDTAVCRILDSKTSSCQYDKLAEVNLYQSMHDLVDIDNVGKERGSLGLIMCPHNSRLEDFIQLRLKGATFNASNDEMAHIWSMLYTNPEPIIMKILNEDSRHWAVPLYLGACGRVIVQTYEGFSLSAAYYNAPWVYRAMLAAKILQAMHDFTFHHPRYSFYFLDLSMENICVNDTPDSAIKFVDLEDMMIVDRLSPYNKAKSKEWNENHTSEILPSCPECLAFEAEAICDHRHSDHNYYVACKLLKEDFLRKTPKTVLQHFPELEEKLSECVEPKKIAGRFEAGKILQKELESIYQQLQKSSVPLNEY